MRKRVEGKAKACVYISKKLKFGLGAITMFW